MFLILVSRLHMEYFSHCILLCIVTFYVNLSVLDGLWGNTVHYCLHNPHMLNRNEAVTWWKASICFVFSYLFQSHQILNSSLRLMKRLRLIILINVCPWCVWPSIICSCAYASRDSSNDYLYSGSLLYFCACEQTDPTGREFIRDEDDCWKGVQRRGCWADGQQSR